MKFVVEAIGVKSEGGIELALRLLEHFRRCANHRFVALLPDLPRYAAAGGGACDVVRFAANAGLARRHFLLNRRVPQICRDERADALLCLGNFAPRDPRCPTVVLLQNAWNVYRERTAEKRLTLRERLIVGYGRRFYRKLPPRVRVVVQTPVMKGRLACFHSADPSNMDVIPSAPAMTGQAEGPARRREKKSGEAFNFLCLSAYRPHKNLEVLIESARILQQCSSRPFRCLITISPGAHPGARNFLACIQREKLEDVLVNLGAVSRAEVGRVYSKADACLLPSLLETVGFAYDEAMHFGLPILTSDRDFARERCGDAALYFDPLDPRSIATAMAGVMGENELCGRLAENGRKRLSHAPGWEDVAARFLHVLEQAAAGATPLALPADAADLSFIAGERHCLN